MKRTPLCIAAAASVLAACSGATTRFYTLEPTASASGPPLAYEGAPFRIDVVHIPATLDRPELVRDDGGGRFTVSDNDHWAAPVGELLRKVLTQDLAKRLPPGAVIFPDAPKLPGSAGLVVDILSITATGDRVAMDASWTLIPASNPNGPTSSGRQRAVSLTAPALHVGVAGDASELSGLAGLLAVAIEEDLSRPAS